MMPENVTITKIKSEIENNKIVLFMKGTPDAPQCGFSAATVEVLRTYKKPFKAIDVLANPDIRATLPDYSHWPTFPQLFVNGQLVGGRSEEHTSELQSQSNLACLLLL